MADASLGPHHLIQVSQITTLLSSSNLLGPDIENQLLNGQLDREQEDWLFSEITQRKIRSNRGTQANAFSTLKKGWHGSTATTSSAQYAGLLADMAGNIQTAGSMSYPDIRGASAVMTTPAAAAIADPNASKTRRHRFYHPNH